jgi:hypothetical protein
MLPAVTELDAAGETPAFSSYVREICKRRVGDVDAESLWSVTRRDVTRVRAALADAGDVEARVDDASPTGTGRPAYSLGGAAKTSSKRTPTRTPRWGSAVVRPASPRARVTADSDYCKSLPDRPHGGVRSHR